jgi:aldose 1-epimerase
MIILSNDAFTLAVRPETGGSIAVFRRSDGLAIFRDALSDSYDDAREGASFPLVPFSNRIRDRRFELGNRQINLEPNVPGADRVAHGFGWRCEWDVVSKTGSSIVIAHDRAASDWPWAYRAEQRLSLIHDGLSMQMSLRNLSNHPMPAGLGFHPFFPLRPGTKVQFIATECHAVGNDGFPAICDAVDDMLAAAATGINPLRGSRYFAGFGGEATITAPGAPSIILRSSAEATHFVFYLAPDSSFFCLEPVTHGVGALCAPRPPADLPEIDMIRPGDQLELAMTIHVADSL